MLCGVEGDNNRVLIGLRVIVKSMDLFPSRVNTYDFRRRSGLCLLLLLLLPSDAIVVVATVALGSNCRPRGHTDWGQGHRVQLVDLLGPELGGLLLLLQLLLLLLLLLETLLLLKTLLLQQLLLQLQL